MREGMPARHAGILVRARRDRALDRENVLPVVLFDRGLEVLLERLTAARTQNMAVFERDAVQHQIGCKRRTRADEGLIAARALVPMQPDHDRQRLRLRRLDDLRHHVRAQPHQGRERHTALQKAAAAHALCEIGLPQALPFTHMNPPNQYTIYN